ncbi:MAG: hypothetical protein RLZZ127_3333, partial [Planctomycetota bacterium]
RTEGHVVAGVVMTFVDISEIRKAAAHNRHLVHAVDQVREVVLFTDHEGAIIGVNEAFSRVYGYAKTEVTGRNPRLLQSGLHDQDFWAGFWSTLTAGGTWRGRLRNRTKSGQVIDLDCQVSPVGRHGAVDGYLLVGNTVADA